MYRYKILNDGQMTLRLPKTDINKIVEIAESQGVTPMNLTRRFVQEGIKVCNTIKN